MLATSDFYFYFTYPVCHFCSENDSTLNFEGVPAGLDHRFGANQPGSYFRSNIGLTHVISVTHRHSLIRTDRQKLPSHNRAT